ncbi:MAG: carbohydrate kinase [Bacteroidales bacterium]|nr:carbohydrate kinase [Bacteroidales bacterium]
MYFLGYDIGSSSVKASLISGDNGKCVASVFYPETEMPIIARHPGWAEQEPEMWWENLKQATRNVLIESAVHNTQIKAIGISYQMHGLVLVDRELGVLRPSIIWCDSRATDIGNYAFLDIGKEHCLTRLLNSPGNFTASKLRWVKEHEPEVYGKIHKMMLPGDYIAMKLTGEISTTPGGLSEGIMWNFKENGPARIILDYYGIDEGLLPEITPAFSVQGEVSKFAAKETGLAPGTAVTYRAGDQPNNAFSLNVLQPGEIAATAGTSGVVYGVSDTVKYDPESRVNTFVHVNHHYDGLTRLGVLLCINGTGIMNSWLRKNVSGSPDYDEMNKIASGIPVGSDGLTVLPFGNGAERMLGNRNIGSMISNLNFNIHKQGHMLRAAQEGIAFSFKYGMDIMSGIGISPAVIRAGHSNMFLSPVFRKTLSSVTNSIIELYNTDGSVGAARAAGVGAGYYPSFADAFAGLKRIEVEEPDVSHKDLYENAYRTWKSELDKILKSD